MFGDPILEYKQKLLIILFILEIYNEKKKNTQSLTNFLSISVNCKATKPNKNPKIQNPLFSLL